MLSEHGMSARVSLTNRKMCSTPHSIPWMSQKVIGREGFSSHEEVLDMWFLHGGSLWRDTRFSKSGLQWEAGQRNLVTFSGQSCSPSTYHFFCRCPTHQEKSKSTSVSCSKTSCILSLRPLHSRSSREMTMSSETMSHAQWWPQPFHLSYLQ